MAEFKLVIAQKDGKCVSKELKSPDADVLLSLKLGDKFSGDSVGLHGYEFQITGGSDKSGFPMRKDIEGILRKRIYSSKTMGLKTSRPGQKLRRSFAGNTVFNGIAQINVIVTKQGSKPLAEPKAEEAPAAE